MWFTNKAKRPIDKVERPIRVTEAQKRQAFVSHVLATVDTLPANVWQREGNGYKATTENGAMVSVHLHKGGLDCSDTYSLTVDDEVIAHCEIWGSSPLEKSGRDDVITLFRDIQEKVKQRQSDRFRSGSNSRNTRMGPKATAKEVEEENKRQDILRRL